MSLQNPADLLKCTNCTRPMRPRGVLKKDAPDTMAWGHSGQCKSCIQPNTPERRSGSQHSPKENTPIMPIHTDEDFDYDREDDSTVGFYVEDPAARQRRVPEAVRLKNTVTGLEAFMARRHQRVAPEPVNPIVWGREETEEPLANAA